jgi:hypothetical protein
VTRRTPPAPAPTAIQVDVAPTRVELAAGGHSVVVESATETLNTLAKKALSLWQATDGDPSRGESCVGFIAAEPGTDMPNELTLPGRLADGPADRRTHTGFGG